VDFERILVDFVYHADLPNIFVLNVKFITDFKLFPATLFARVSVHRPLITVILHLNHEDVSIFDILTALINQNPLVVIFCPSLYPKPCVSCRNVVEEFTYL
jgi:hypothetical protein